MLVLSGVTAATVASRVAATWPVGVCLLGRGRGGGGGGFGVVGSAAARAWGPCNATSQENKGGMYASLNRGDSMFALMSTER